MSNVFLAVFLETRGCCRLFIGFVGARRTIVSMASLCRGIVLRWNWIKQTIFRKSVDLKVRKDKMHRWETPRAKGLLLRARLSRRKREIVERENFSFPRGFSSIDLFAICSTKRQRILISTERLPLWIILTASGPRLCTLHAGSSRNSRSYERASKRYPPRECLRGSNK